ncbi:MAG: PEP-CTERM sorting domain-containing protein, partial [bacterium]|nr:PEP-CTERM sorting domain-containing protein [bacterium]
MLNILTRRSLFTCLFVAVSIFAVASPVFGVIPGQTSDLASQTGQWGGMNWDYVYNWAGSSAVAVDDYWMLTVAHVADDPGGIVGSTIVIDSTTYTLQEIVYAPIDSGQTAPVDLAMLRFDKALPGHYDLYTGSLTGLDTIVVGYGTTGTDMGSYYTLGGGAGTERWGTNQIDIPNIRVLSSTAFSSLSFRMDFESGDTTYEAGFGVHDSGGGTFVKLPNGQWVLAGVNAYIGTNGTTGQYDKLYSISVPEYEGWVTQTVPEPATMLLLGLGG